MNDRRLLSSTFWAMVIVQTVASVDLPGLGDRKLPSPSRYVAIVVLWGILNLIADAGPSYARFASRLSVLVALTGAVAGPFGSRAVGLLQWLGHTFTLAPATATPGGGASVSVPPPTSMGV